MEENQNDVWKKLAFRWRDPVVRMQDTFNVRRADGTLTPLIVPAPQRKIIRDGILCHGYEKMKRGLVTRRCINKGRQTGFSIIQAAEAILIAMDFPNTFQFYIATKEEQASSWLNKLRILVEDANHFPKELGGGPIIKADDIRPMSKKIINNCVITGLVSNPGGIRGDTAISVIMDEYDWMIRFKNQQQETYAACKHFVSQGGQLTIQSTPRSTTGQFMEFFNEHEKHGFIAYYCPTITNWQELNLNEPLYISLDNEERKLFDLSDLNEDEKQTLIDKYERKGFTIDSDYKFIKQDAVIPYPWKTLQELEVDRRSDVEFFKQENLGVAIDERYKVLKSEWIYNNLIEGDEWVSRKDSFNPFVIGVDIAKEHDLFIVTIFEIVDNHYFLRKVEIMPPGQNYQHSADRLVELNNAFKPMAMRVDNTGGGIPFCDMLENTACKSILQRIIFSNEVKMNLAENLRAITQDGKLHMLDNTQEHRIVIRHLLKVERQFLETSTRYTGKGVDAEGRDDGFWSVALALCDNPSRNKKMAATNIKAAFGRISKGDIGASKLTGNKYEILRRELDKHRGKSSLEEESEDVREFEEEKRYKETKKQLEHSLLACPKLHKAICPLECVGCDKIDCYDWRYHQDVLKKQGVPLKAFQRWLELKK